MPIGAIIGPPRRGRHDHERRDRIVREIVRRHAGHGRDFAVNQTLGSLMRYDDGPMMPLICDASAENPDPASD
jgi:hypothetical protein